ncbi:hypothetical protein POTOM_050503 [Populus tomentosa]|uniref:RNase III domain-containing protein n=1 Tax=Populus tomentosa TaxID=118781 RepID=A0A8X7Y495_POPTO|nr:hypothetical protein POTOM_050503 [Populus tomentosa]
MASSRFTVFTLAVFSIFSLSQKRRNETGKISFSMQVGAANKLKLSPFESALDTLQNQIGYAFKNIGYLRRAMTHSSFSEENNKALSILGSNVIDTSVSMALFGAIAIDTKKADDAGIVFWKVHGREVGKAMVIPRHHLAPLIGSIPNLGLDGLQHEDANPFLHPVNRKMAFHIETTSSTDIRCSHVSETPFTRAFWSWRMDISGGLGMLPQLHGSDAYFTVSDLISASHNWDFRVLRTPFPQFIQDTIRACP